MDIKEIEKTSPKKQQRKKLNRSKSEAVAINRRKGSPVKKNFSKNEEFSDNDEDEDLLNTENGSKIENNGKPKKPKIKQLIFSDEEEESPFGVSKGGGKNYWRRTTYLDILKIEKERRESIKKMKEEKDKEKEKGGSKSEPKEKFIRDSFGNKVFLSSKGKKDAEKDEAPDHIDIAIQDIVSKSLVISSNANYGRNRESLISMIKRKLKDRDGIWT